MEEVWKDIPGYDGKYKISNLGNISSTKRGKLKLMKHSISNLGYHRITLYKDGVNKHYAIHRLVAQAFIPNEHNYPFINHKDENPGNNSVDNLEWCTPSYNINYGKRNQKVSEASHPIRQTTEDGFILATYYSANFAAKMLEFDVSILYRCLRGNAKTAYGYKWEYIDSIHDGFSQ